MYDLSPRVIEYVLSGVHSYFLLPVLACFCLRAVYLVWFHPLSDVPGPRIAAVTDLWKTLAVSRGCFATALRLQHARYGDIVRIGPNEVSIIAPHDVNMMYGPKSEFRKGPFYDAFAIVGKGHFSDRNEATHGIRRRSIAPAYSLNHLTSLEKYCDGCTGLLFDHLDHASKSGSLVDLSKLVEWYTYDCVSGIGFGDTFGLLQSGRDPVGVLEMMAETTRTIATAATLSNFGWILPTRPVAWLTVAILGKRGPNLLIKYALRLVESRQKLKECDPRTYEEGKDMLYRFMEATDLETSSHFDLRGLLGNTITIIQAGADTTRASIVAFLRYVYAHPTTVERLRREIDDAVIAGDLEFPIKYAQATRLEFLWACMKEAMRLHPAVGMPLQRVVPPGGRVIGGRYYRAGTLVGMAARELHYDTRTFGQDADHWRPERWLEGERNDLEKFNLTFGQGTRGCLGRNLALMEMSKLLSSIVYYYDLVIHNPERPWKVHETWFQTQSDFFCVVTRRKETSSYI